MLEDEGIHEDFEPSNGPSGWEGERPSAEDAEDLLAELDAVDSGSEMEPPAFKQKRIKDKRAQIKRDKAGGGTLTERVEAEAAVQVPTRVGKASMQEPVSVPELYLLSSDEQRAKVLHRASSALEDVPADRQEDVYHEVRDRAVKALQGAKGSRRAAEAFVDRHLSQPLGERSPFTRDGLRDVDVTALDAPSMLVEGLIPCGELGIITGDSGTGKSWLVAELARAVAFGGSWLGHPVETTGHVRLFLPEGRISYPQRIAGGMIHRGELEPGASRSALAEALAGRISITDGHTVLDDPRLEEHLRVDIEEHGTRLVVFDTLNRSLGAGQDENDTGDSKAVVNMLHRLAADTGCTFLLIHHPPHGEKRERGSRVWRDAPDFRFLIYGTDRDVRQGKPVTLWNAKQRNIAPADTIGYRLRERRVQYDGEDVSTCTVERASVRQDVPLADRIRWYVEENPGLPKSRVVSGVQGDNTELDTEINRLVDEGKLTNANEGKPGAWALHVAGEWEQAEDEFSADLSDVSESEEAAGNG